MATLTTAASTQVLKGSAQDESKQERKAEKKDSGATHKKTGGGQKTKAASKQNAAAGKSDNQVQPEYTRYKKAQTSPVFRADGSSKDPAMAAKPAPKGQKSSVRPEALTVKQKTGQPASNVRPEALTVKQKTGQATNTAKPDAGGKGATKSAAGQDKKTEKQESGPKQ